MRHISQEEESFVQKKSDCQTTKDSVKYLGLYLSGTNKDIFQNNCTKLYREIYKKVLKGGKFKKLP